MKLFGSFTRGKNGIAVRSPDLTRRGLIVGAAASLIAAPAIVRAASLMPVKASPETILGFEFDVDQLLTKSWEKYSFGWQDWRVLWGQYSQMPVQWDHLAARG